MTFLARARFSYIDLATCAVASTLLRQGHWGWALGAMAVGLVVDCIGKGRDI